MPSDAIKVNPPAIGDLGTRAVGAARRRRRWDVRSRRGILVACLVVNGLVAAAFGTVRIPVPELHDEFSYLLAADTFASGRLTNPTHPAWSHLESFHILQRPTYQSKYPPGHALFLALGWRLGGHPIVGVWLELLFATGAMVWCLQGWLPRRWALLMGLLVAIHPLIQWEWGQSYRMGTLPMAAGALLFGSVARLGKYRPARLSTGLAAGGGIVLLAITRPFEGVVACLGAACMVAWQYRAASPYRVASPCGWSQADRGALCQRVIAPAAIVVAAGMVGILGYNQAVTGSPWRMPYQVYQSQYGYSPLFIWQALPTAPHYTHPIMQELYHGWELEWYLKHFSWSGFWEVKGYGLNWLWLFYLGVPLTIPLFLLPRIWRNGRRRGLVWSWLAGWGAVQLVPWFFPHYLAPFAAPLFIVVGDGFRRLWQVRQPNGKNLVAMCVGLQVVSLAATWWHAVHEPRDRWQWQRERLAQEIRQLPGEHVVIVCYDPRHQAHGEWVYNEADLTRAKIVWLRDDPTEDLAETLRYFPGRRVWTIYPDQPGVPRMAGAPLPAASLPATQTEPGPRPETL